MISVTNLHCILFWPRVSTQGPKSLYVVSFRHLPFLAANGQKTRGHYPYVIWSFLDWKLFWNPIPIYFMFFFIIDNSIVWLKVSKIFIHYYPYDLLKKTLPLLPHFSTNGQPETQRALKYWARWLYILNLLTHEAWNLKNKRATVKKNIYNIDRHWCLCLFVS